jgi:predicted Rdx family selenoprotein
MRSGLWKGRDMRATTLVKSVLAFGLACGSAAAESPLNSIEDALGGPIIECTGSVIWEPETEGGSPATVPYNFAVRDAADADRIALFESDQPFSEENVWPCQEGLCSAVRVMRSGVTVLRFASTQEDAGTEYLTQWAYVVVGASDNALIPESVTGEGVFRCTGVLSERLLTRAR